MSGRKGKGQKSPEPEPKGIKPDEDGQAQAKVQPQEALDQVLGHVPAQPQAQPQGQVHLQPHVHGEAHTQGQTQDHAQGQLQEGPIHAQPQGQAHAQLLWQGQAPPYPHPLAPPYVHGQFPPVMGPVHPGPGYWLHIPHRTPYVDPTARYLTEVRGGGSREPRQENPYEVLENKARVQGMPDMPDYGTSFGGRGSGDTNQFASRDKSENEIGLATTGQSSWYSMVQRSNPPYIKQGDMPVTTDSLKQPVIALAHQGCELCTRPFTTYQCRGCFMVSYCSEAHQAQHWPIHQAVCTPLTYVSKPGDLEHGIPTQVKVARDMEENTLLIQTSPLMMAPSDRRGTAAQINSVLCLGCCAWFPIDHHNARRCCACGWPVCSKKCAKDSLHSEYECQVFAAGKVLPNNFNLMYDAVLALRVVLLKDKNPETYDLLMLLQHVGKLATRSEGAAKEDEILARFLLDKCQINEFLPEPVDLPTLKNLVKIVDWCSVMMPEFPITKFMDELGQTLYISARYVFLRKPLFTEDCSPNTRWQIRHGSTLAESKIRITSTIQLQRGTPLTVSWYIDSEFGTVARRRVLHFRFSDQCYCNRCLDPSELGSEFQTFLCKPCRPKGDKEWKTKAGTLVGHIRQVDPLSVQSAWKCCTPGCRTKLNHQDASEKLKMLMAECESAKERFEQLQAFIQKYENIELHVNHYLIIRAKHYIIRHVVHEVRNRGFEDVNPKMLELGEQLTGFCMYVHGLITPGHSLMRGRLLYYLQMLRGIQTIRKAQISLAMKDYGALQTVPAIFAALHQIQLESYNILKDEAYGTHNYDNALILKEIIEDQDMELLFRQSGSLFDKPLLTRLRAIYSRMTGDFNPMDLEFDEELANFKLAWNHIPECQRRKNNF